MHCQKDRILREKEAYNQGIPRANYDRFLSGRGNSHYFFSQHRQTHIQAMCHKDNCTFLELGSTTWHSWLDPLYTKESNWNVTCINISQVELNQGKALAHRARLHPEFKLMDAHDLQFPDHSFDRVFGGAILHHLDLDIALSEIKRVLKPNGIAFFLEPLDINPVGRLVRAATPRQRTPDEVPFRVPQLRQLEQKFLCTYQYEQLLSVPFGVITGLLKAPNGNQLMRAVYHADQLLFKFPFVGLLARYFLVTMRPRNG